MPRSLNVRRSLALTAALVAATWGTAALPASADPGAGQSGAHAQSDGNANQPQAATSKQAPKAKDSGKGKGSGTGAGSGNGSGKGSGTGSGKGSGTGSGTGTGAASTGKGSHGDPAGNNGTVKIAPLGEMDGIPQNSPHPGCTFQVEWYGYDEGADIVSTVSFAMQAPTNDVELGVDGNPSVFVGGDPASGAGTDTGLDGTETYTLSFTGEPQAQQGYHVKLTVATPRSNGNDTKTKVFWVDDCTSEVAGTTAGADETAGTTDDTTTAEAGTETEAAQAEAGTGDDIEVMGAQASAELGADTEAAQAAAGEAQVPTAVDAGENGSVLDWVRSPLPLLVIALGAVLAAAAFVTRRRTSVRAGK